MTVYKNWVLKVAGDELGKYFHQISNAIFCPGRGKEMQEDKGIH
jgi:hypothetical protein